MSPGSRKTNGVRLHESGGPKLKTRILIRKKNGDYCCGLIEGIVSAFPSPQYLFVGG